jgi:hypothetical protein
MVSVERGSLTMMLLDILNRPGKKWMQSSSEQVRESDWYNRGISSGGRKT